ncbi:MAG: hypothetical protein WCP82_04590 [Alphaproteobacteria bacterium]
MLKSFKTRTALLAAVCAVGLAGGVAIAQTIAVPTVTSMGITDIMQVVKGGVPSAQSTYATLLQLRNFILAGNSQVGATAPTLSGCGTGSPAVVGTNSAGVITVGTTATGCIATFATAYVSAPACAVVSQTAPATTTPAYSVSTTAITITQASGSGNKYSYICIAQPGG